MTRDQIIKELTLSVPAFKRYALNVSNEQDYEDLFQEVYLILLELPEDKLLAAYNPTQGLKPFFLRLCCNQYRSSTSKFHKDYRKQEQFLQSKGSDVAYNEQGVKLEAEETDFDKLHNLIDKVWFLNSEFEPNEIEKMVFRLYLVEGSLRRTLKKLPADIRDKFDLKAVHEITKKFRRTIKKGYDENFKIKLLTNVPNGVNRPLLIHQIKNLEEMIKDESKYLRPTDYARLEELKKQLQSIS